jgi:hypothetical protein
MEALGVLAVAARDIRALGTARADSRPLRRLRPSARDPASPFQSARENFCGIGHRTFNVETACAMDIFLAD